MCAHGNAMCTNLVMNTLVSLSNLCLLYPAYALHIHSVHVMTSVYASEFASALDVLNSSNAPSTDRVQCMACGQGAQRAHWYRVCILSTRFTMNNLDFLCLAYALPPLLPFSWIPTPNKACTIFRMSACIGCIARIECTACSA